MFTLIKKDGRARRGRFVIPSRDNRNSRIHECGDLRALSKAVWERMIFGRSAVRSCFPILIIWHGPSGRRTCQGNRRSSSDDRWTGPVLTDSGGFQVFSLSQLRRIREEGVYFSSHVDGKHIFMGPEESMRIQSNLASTIAMAFDECIENPAEYKYTKASCDRTVRWLERCKKELDRLNSLDDTLNREQMLFGINQGSTYEDLRIEHMERIAELDLPGYAIGGLAVGEEAEEMYRIIDAVEPHMPADRPRYLMGVGTPQNILEAVHLGVDFFDCVMPSRNARHGNVFTWNGKLNIMNEKYAKDTRPIEEGCGCPACRRGYSKAYIRHLLKAKESFGMRLAVSHNLYFYNSLTAKIREALDGDYFESFYQKYRTVLAERSPL